MKKTIKSYFLVAAALMVGQASAEAKRVYPFEFAPSVGIVNEVERPFRQEICLNGYWDFQPSALGSGSSGAVPAPCLYPAGVLTGWKSQ